jgi:hypothetical protein
VAVRDCIGEFLVAIFATRKLRVMDSSVNAPLGGGGNRRNRLAFGPRQRSRPKQNRRAKLAHRRADERMGENQPRHVCDAAAEEDFVRMRASARQGANVVLGWKLDPGIL